MKIKVKLSTNDFHSIFVMLLLVSYIFLLSIPDTLCYDDKVFQASTKHNSNILKNAELVQISNTFFGGRRKGMKLLSKSIRDKAINNEMKLEEAVSDYMKLNKIVSKNTDEQKLTRRMLQHQGSFSCHSVRDFFKRRKQRKEMPSGSPNAVSLQRSESMNGRLKEDLQIALALNSIAIPTVNGEFWDRRGKRRTRNEWPIVYSKEYDVNLCGLEKLHKFDTKKWRNIISYLKKENMLTEKSISVPDEADPGMLHMIHTPQYLQSLQSSKTISMITELPCLTIAPDCMIDEGYLKPMRFQVGGTILAGELALYRGWAINIGGGFHHASAYYGEGNCPYADITLLIKWLFGFYPNYVRKAMIVDLDAHQGNGHARDFYYDQEQVFILDVYNKDSLPDDFWAKTAITRKVELDPFTTDDEYIYQVETNLEYSLRIFRPDILVYNAGTDILKGDVVGRLAVSAVGIIKRDEIVFIKARKYEVPIVMLTSGGYRKQTADVIARSILNLKNLNLIQK